MAPKRPVRTVLIHPPLRSTLDAATPDYVDENRCHMPPMGLLYLLAAVEEAGHEGIFLDADLEELDHAAAAERALAGNPEVVALQAMTFTLRDALLLAREVKKRAPEIVVIMGGPHPTIYPLETAALDGVDFAFAGEGEYGLVRFLDCFPDRNAMAAVPGIAAVVDGEPRHVPGPKQIPDIDALPLPARAATPYKRYASVLSQRTPSTTMITSRGCPFNCIFCNRMGRKLRCHSAAYVLREIDSIHDLGIKEIFIHDDTFSVDRKRVEAICLGLLERDYDLIWEARTRVDCVDRDLLALMRRAGCHRLSFGVESGSERVLRSMRKGIDLQQVERVFGWCRDEGIVTLADFMLGNLDEEEEDIRKTFGLLRRLRPDYVQFSVLTPYPNTPIYALALERGLIPTDIWREFATDPMQDFKTPVWTQHFSEDQLQAFTAKAYRSFYMRPGFILKQLRSIHSLSQLRAMARAAMGILRGRG
jgi:radical SAM superfamily enzyme YgiQ (UPF0313 family)